MNTLTIKELSDALITRLHTNPGYIKSRSWSTAQWLQAVVGELGEFANINKKVDRGDLTPAEALPAISKELADTLAYLVIMADQLGVDLSAASVQKFNEVSKRIDCSIELAEQPNVDGMPFVGQEAYGPHGKGRVTRFEVVDNKLKTIKVLDYTSDCNTTWDADHVDLIVPRT